MKSIKYLFYCCVITTCASTYAQNSLLSGTVESTEGVEGIHIINKSQKLFTATAANGTFNIEAKLNDTLTVSSLQHKKQNIVVSESHISTKELIIKLELKINELDEVVVGKLLTGNLHSDIGNSEAKPKINFYDVGIPGYKGKPKTQSERRLQEATDLKPTLGGDLGGPGGSLQIVPLINAITGRTKELKLRVKLEAEQALIESIKARLAPDFFIDNPLKEDLQIDFLYFCSEDENFMKRCKNSDLEIIVFLEEKYKAYLINLNTKE